MVSSNKILPKTNLASVSTFLYLFIIFMLFGIFFILQSLYMENILRLQSQPLEIKIQNLMELKFGF